MALSVGPDEQGERMPACVCVCVCVCVCTYVCMYVVSMYVFFYWLCMLHYHWVILPAISYSGNYPGDDLCFTLFEIPLRYMVFVIVGQSLLILKRLAISPYA
jgi:hypothetical protein